MVEEAAEHAGIMVEQPPPPLLQPALMAQPQDRLGPQPLVMAPVDGIQPEMAQAGMAGQPMAYAHMPGPYFMPMPGQQFAPGQVPGQVPGLVPGQVPGQGPGQPQPTSRAGSNPQAQQLYMPMAMPMGPEYAGMHGYGYMPVYPMGYPPIHGGLMHGRIGNEADNLVMLHNSRRGVNKRWVLEPEDSILLERVFALEKCPGRELCQELATRLKVRPRQVQVWFQNRRQRTKSNAAKDTQPATGDTLQAANDAASRSEMLMKLLAHTGHPIATATPAGDGMPGVNGVEIAHPIATATPADDSVANSVPVNSAACSVVSPDETGANASSTDECGQQQELAEAQATVEVGVRMEAEAEAE